MVVEFYLPWGGKDVFWFGLIWLGLGLCLCWMVLLIDTFFDASCSSRGWNAICFAVDWMGTLGPFVRSLGGACLVKYGIADVHTLHVGRSVRHGQQVGIAVHDSTECVQIRLTVRSIPTCIRRVGVEW